ncbi:MAG: glycosyltransferase family 39 protein [Lacunisphaera sp.]
MELGAPMPGFFSSIIFAVDVLCVATLAGVIVGGAGLNRYGALEAIISWLLLVFSIVIFSGVILGECGLLGPVWFCAVHGVGLIVTAAFFRRNSGGWIAVRNGILSWWSAFRHRTADIWIVGGFILVFGYLGWLTAHAEPVVYDALTYRLSRIGQWLQDGRIHHFQTDDPRLNYMPLAPDLVIAWVLGATAEGFKGAAISQLAAGVLLLMATFGLARTVGLNRWQAWGAVVVVLGMGNVAAQFTAVQSDLFTAGLFAASYLLFHRAIVRGRYSWLAGIGLGLAWSSKGTMFYVAPGFLVWLLWLGWRRWSQRKEIVFTGLFALLAVLVCSVPGYVRNLSSYHSLFGPPEAMQLHHGGTLTVSGHFEKLRMNLETSAIQLCDPTAQPLWLQNIARKAGVYLTQFEPDRDDRFLFLHTATRRDLIGYVIAQTEPDADVISCGLIAVALFFTGVGVALLYFRSGWEAKQVLAWSAGIVAYLLVQHALVQWHQWAFRFMVLIAPWMAVVGVWGVSRLPRKIQLGLWAMIAASQLQVFAAVQCLTNQDAWQARTQPDRALGHFVYSHWRQWADQLDDTGRPLRLAFPINHIISAFYRMSPPRRVSLEKFSELNAATAEVAVGTTDGWLLVPIGRFKGREGRVDGRTWLFNGEADPLYGVAAFRRLAATESPSPLVYRSTRKRLSNGLERRMTIKSWSTPLRVRIENNAAHSWRVIARDGNTTRSGIVTEGGSLVLALPIKPLALEDLVFQFEGASPEESEASFPSVEALP